MRNILGMIIGAALDRRDGDSGVKGALLGAVAQGGVRAVLPLAATAGAGWLIYKGARRLIGGSAGARRSVAPRRPGVTA